MSDFAPKIEPELLDIAYEDAEELIESFVCLWRAMANKGTPVQFLAAEGKGLEYDSGFHDGGLVALEALLAEFVAKRDTIFLEG
jgi:hypothetical protein